MQNTTPNKNTPPQKPVKTEGNTAPKEQGKDNVKKENQQQGQNQQQHGHKNQNQGGRGRGRPNRGGRGGGHGGGQHRFNQNQAQGGQNQQNQGSQQFGGFDQAFLPVQEGPKEKKKFTGRCRLFVGNITPDTTEDEFKDLFKPFGEINECFVNGAKGFGFIRLDYRHNAEAAKAALDGQERKGRHLRVRFANHGAAVRVKNLSVSVTNELLEQCFSQFGEIERAIVVADERGRSVGEGLVEFARKPGAQAAIKRCTEGILLLTAYPRPVIVEPVEAKDEEDGVSERYLPRHDQMRMDREKEPRFAPPGSFEYRFAMKYREVDEMEKQQMERVKKEMDEMRVKLESEMEGAMYEYQAEQIRADLMRQQEELQRIEEMRLEQMRRRQEFDTRRDEETRMMREEDERRREMLMRGDMGMRGNPRAQMEQREGRGRGAGGPPPIPPPPVPPMGMGGINKEETMTGNTGIGGGRYTGQTEEEAAMTGEEGGDRGQMQSRFQGTGGFGGNGRGFDRGMGMGGGMQSQGAGLGGFGGRPPMGRGGIGMDRRREGGVQEDFGEMKRMRRY